MLLVLCEVPSAADFGICPHDKLTCMRHWALTPMPVTVVCLALPLHSQGLVNSSVSQMCPGRKGLKVIATLLVDDVVQVCIEGTEVKSTTLCK